jgi:hypothetical protein
MTERMIEANELELCTESFGDPADPPILLIEAATRTSIPRSRAARARPKPVGPAS